MERYYSQCQPCFFKLNQTFSKEISSHFFQPQIKNYLDQSTRLTTENNWAFLDMQNLHKGVCEEGWKIKWEYFREYLRKELNVTKLSAS